MATHDEWAPSVPTSAGAVVVPGYSDLTEVARGGDSIVYRARQDSLGRDVAVKVIDVTEPTAQARFARELAITVRLGRQHPHVVSVIDTTTTADGRPCLVMEFHDLGSLHDRLREHGSLAVSDVVAAGTAVADALAFAHAHGVLHRDVKPQNVLLLPTSYVLSDFGIARMADSGHTASLERFSYRHASPQVLDGAEPTAADDVWSLGSTLFTLLDGRAPFASDDPDDDSALAYLRRVRMNERRPLPADVPSGLRQVVEACLTPGREARTWSAADVLAALRRVPTEERSWAPGVVGPTGEGGATSAAGATTESGTTGEDAAAAEGGTTSGDAATGEGAPPHVGPGPGTGGAPGTATAPEGGGAPGTAGAPEGGGAPGTAGASDGAGARGVAPAPEATGAGGPHAAVEPLEPTAPGVSAPPAGTGVERTGAAPMTTVASASADAADPPAPGAAAEGRAPARDDAAAAAVAGPARGNDAAAGAPSSAVSPSALAEIASSAPLDDDHTSAPPAPPAPEPEQPAAEEPRRGNPWTKIAAFIGGALVVGTGAGILSAVLGEDEEPPAPATSASAPVEVPTMSDPLPTAAGPIQASTGDPDLAPRNPAILDNGTSVLLTWAEPLQEVDYLLVLDPGGADETAHVVRQLPAGAQEHTVEGIDPDAAQVCFVVAGYVVSEGTPVMGASPEACVSRG